MPIARYQLPDGRVARFEVPEGTTPEQAQQIGQDYFAQQQADTGFDLESFDPAGPIGQVEPKQKQTIQALATEFAAGFNRPIFQLIDAFGTDTVNAALNLAGSKTQLPGMMKTFGAERGEFAGEGLGADIAATAGELASMGGMVGGALRQGARFLPQAARGESALVGTAREMTKTGPGIEATTGALSGVGQEVGQELGGDVGAVVGGIAAPLAGVAGAQALSGVGRESLEALKTKFRAKPDLIEADTALPTPKFQRSLEKQGLTVGSIIDEPDLIPTVRPTQSTDDIAKRIAVRKIKAGSADEGLADKMLSYKPGKAPEIVPDDLAADSIKKGWDRGYVGAVKNADRQTKDRMVEMLTIRRRQMVDRAIDDRPLDIAGDEVFKRFQFLRDKNKGLRAELDAASKELKGKRLNTGPVEDTVFDLLDNLNMNIPEEVLLDTRKLREFVATDEPFQKTVIAADGAAKRMIRETVKLLDTASDDAFNAHILKKQLDTLIDYGRSESKLTPSGEQFVKPIRAAVNDIIRDASPAYAKVNDDLSMSLGAINSLVEPLPKAVKDNMYKPNFDAALGKQMRKLESNYATGDALKVALDELQEATTSLGGTFDVDIRRLVNFNNALDTRFGPSMAGSLAGQQEIGAKAALRGVERPLEALKEAALQPVAEKITKFMTHTDEQAFNSMQRLLKRK